LGRLILEKPDIFNLHQAVQTQVVMDIYSEHLMQLWLKDFNAQNELINEQQVVKILFCFKLIHQVDILPNQSTL
jgi:hypothetical protein